MAYNMENMELRYADEPQQQQAVLQEPMDSSDFVAPVHNSRRKWYYIGGALLIAAVAAGAGIGLSGGSSAPKSAAVFDDAPQQSPPAAPAPASPSPPTSEVYDLLKNFGVHGGGELDNPDSFQQRAYQFVESTFDEASHDAERLVQRYALACIYYATYEVETRYTIVRFQGSGILPWGDKTGWLEAPNECTWNGIICDDAGVVTELNLAKNTMTGTFPEEAKLLKKLRVLDLEGNHCFNSGPEGSDWIGEMTTLQYLYLSKIPFHTSTGIPIAFNKLTNLKELDVSYAAFRGALDPNLLKDANELVILTLSGNSYNSSIPLTLGRLPKLKYLYASNTDIVGDLSFMQGPELWPKLTEVWMDNNPLLTGSLPSNLGSYSNLVSISFVNGGLTGPLPESMSTLVHLKKFWMFGNQLSGPIPDLTQLQLLEYFQIEDNDLSGVIPDSVGLLTVAGKLVNLHADCLEGCKVTCNRCTCCGPECKTTQLGSLPP